MANLLDRASLVLTPTAYNNGEALCIKPDDGSGDFDFSRNSAATRVNAQGLVENVQILSSNLVQNGDFSEEGTEEVSNGSFSQEGVQLVTNGSFDTDSDWGLQTGWSISGGSLNAVNTNGIAFQSSLGLVIGKTYKVSLNTSNYVSGSARLKLGGSAYQNISTTDSFQEFYFIPTSNTDNIIFSYLSTFTGSIDNCSVREVGQDWTLGTGWSIGEDKAVATNATGNLLQTNVFTIGKTYKINFTINEVTSGNGVRVLCGSTNGTVRNTEGTYIEYLTCTGSAHLFIDPNISFSGSITNISVKEVLQDWSVEDYGAVSPSAVITPNTEGVKLEKTVSADWRSSFLVQPISYTSGSQYKVTFRLKNGNLPSGGSVYVRRAYDSSSQSIVNNLALTNDWVEYTYYFVADSNSEDISFGEVNWQNAGVGQYFYVDDVSIIEITTDTNLPRISYENFSYQDALGSEEVVNGDFSNGLTDWIVDDGTSWTNVNNTAFCDGNNGLIKQGFTSVLNKTYKVTFDVVNVGGGELGVRIGNGTYAWNNYPSGSYVKYLVSGSSTSEGVLFYATSGWTGSIDNVSVKEYLGQEVVPNSGCGSWLWEPQSTNLITQSELLNGYWSNSGATNLISDVISPDGISFSKKVTTTSAGNYKGLLKNESVIWDNKTFTISTFAKRGNTDWLYFYNIGSNNGNNGVWFNLDTGLIGSIGAAWSNVKIETFTNGWYRCSATLSFGAATNYLYILNSDLNNSVFSTLDNYAYIWGTQIEENNISSYIPTSGSTVTRNQDVCTNGGSLATINSTEGVLYAEIAALANDGTNRYITISDGGNSYIRLTYTTTSNQLGARYYINGTFQTALSHILSDETEFIKVSFKWKENDFALWVNGVEVATDTSGNVNPANTFYRLDFSRYDGIFPFFGKTKAVAVWKEALSDSELQSLTTI